MGKKIDKIKIIRRKGGTHSPVIPSTQESPPESPPEMPTFISTETNESQEMEEKMEEKMVDKLLSLLESKDDEYLYHFICRFIENMKDREEEIREKDPQMVALLDELKAMIQDP